LKPFSDKNLRAGFGVSARQRRFYYSAPSFSSTSGNSEDRYISDIGIGGHTKIDYTFFRAGTIILGSQFEGQFFLPIHGEYFFQEQPIPLQNLQFPFAPIILSLGAFLRIGF
jgi:hypothetical protein